MAQRLAEFRGKGDDAAFRNGCLQDIADAFGLTCGRKQHDGEQFQRLQDKEQAGFLRRLDPVIPKDIGDL